MSANLGKHIRKVDWLIINIFIYYGLGYAYQYAVYLNLYKIEILNIDNSEEARGMYGLFK